MTNRAAALMLLLGAWLGVSVSTVAGAVLAFRAAGVTKTTHAVDLDQGARAQAVRFNQGMFRASGRAQILLGAACVALAAWPPRPSNGAAAAIVVAAAITAVLATFVAPRIAALGSELLGAMASDGAVASARARSARLHGIHATLDLAKTLLVVVGFTLAARGWKRRSAAP